jgi:Protein of unknown function (DUF3089)
LIAKAAGPIVALALLAAPAGAVAAPDPTVWLCKPGIPSNPCDVDQDTTFVSPSGEILGVYENASDPPGGAARPKIDCFYVYPTVSDQDTVNADLSIDPELRSVALYQAARYSGDCRVFAPVYRQLTLAAITGQVPITAEASALAYSDVLSAWKSYLKRYNHGRGVVLISHSQGTFNLRRLVSEEIDPKRKLRQRLVSALLLGGGVTVRAGEDVGGDFDRIRACRSDKQLHCVVAFSTFNAPVPPDAIFGRTSVPGHQVLCTNPAALGGGSAPLKSVVPSEPFAPGTTIGLATEAVGFPRPHVPTPWIEADGAYSGECSSADNANVLQLTDAPGAPHLIPIPENFGLHLVDGNIALGNLTDLVRKQAKRYLRRFG